MTTLLSRHPERSVVKDLPTEPCGQIPACAPLRRAGFAPRVEPETQNDDSFGRPERAPFSAG